MEGFVLDGNLTIPVVEVIYRPHNRLSKRPFVSSFRSAGTFFRETWQDSAKESAEKIRVMLLSRAYQVLGIYDLEEGIKTVTADPRSFFLPALRVGAHAICIGRFVPEDDPKPGIDDHNLLRRLIEAGRILHIDIWDYVITDADNFFSCRNEGLLSDDLINDKMYCTTGNTKVDFLRNSVQEVHDLNIDHHVSDPDTSAKIDAKSISLFTRRLHDFRASITTFPALLKGPVRSIKIEPHYRESRATGYFRSRDYTVTNKIRLIGDWIADTGVSYTRRVKVIPLERLLIIVPEEKNNTDE